MEIKMSFHGNKKVNANFDGFSVATDQPKGAGGDGTAPSPFDLFLASLGTCTGFFALSFCQKRGISMEGLELTQNAEWDDTKHLMTKISLHIKLPADFPEKYRDGLIKAVNLCTVKRHLHEPPEMEVLLENK